MTRQTIRNFVFAAAAAVVLTAGTAQAEIRRSQPISIPYEFQVDKTKMPAGEYRVEQDSMSEFALLVNNKTGERVFFLRPKNVRTPGKATLTLVPGETGVKVKVS
jgi:hypothetical protein